MHDERNIRRGARSAKSSMKRAHRPAALALAAALAAGIGPAHAEAAGACSEDGELRLHVPSPDWRDQLIYMAFIDRFEDGDPSNNDQGQGEYDPSRGSHFSGGDIQGIIGRLGYLKSLGVTAIWVTPPVANQWWSTPYRSAGWHGYWAVDFREVDAHFGTLNDYRQLSHALHCNGMYLIQDIVVNHVGNFFEYAGEYDPNDTAKNFRLLEADSAQPAPSQPPFHQIDRNNPDHVAADIYHWTPTIADFSDRNQELNYSLGLLSDINTENPEVIEVLKNTYKHWMDAAGLDGFRLDTASLVDHEFWRRFMRDEDGIYAHAKRLGKNHFLTFGEVSAFSQPYRDEGERRVASYLGTAEKPELNSVLNYPLYYEIKRVLTEGQATAQLAHRLQTYMALYADPHVAVNFIDNQDTPRFLSAGPTAAFRQALALLFTLPGIPVIYQGTEQGLTEPRPAMFAGGFLNERGSFDPGSRHYRYLQGLASLRRENPALSRGGLEILASEPAGPGLFAYRRDHKDEALIVLMNSASHRILVHDLDAGIGPNQPLDALLSEQFAGPVASGPKGLLNLELPARTVLVLRPSGVGEAQAQVKQALTEPLDALKEGLNLADGIALDAAALEGATLTEDFQLAGTAAPGARLKLILNGDLDLARDLAADQAGRWQATVPVRDLGEARNYLQIHAPESNALSRRLRYATRVTEAEIEAAAEDAADDAHGPTGNYIRPQHPQSGAQKDILAARARVAGRNLELTLEMAEVTDGWQPFKGFDNVAFTIFLSLPQRDGATALPLLNAEMPGRQRWQLAHFAGGWFSLMYRAEGAAANRQGEKLGVSPDISADKAQGAIRFLYEGASMGVQSWAGAGIYITTWDHEAEGRYLDASPEPGNWVIGGAVANAPKIMDDLFLRIPGKG